MDCLIELDLLPNQTANITKSTEMQTKVDNQVKLKKYSLRKSSALMFCSGTIRPALVPHLIPFYVKQELMNGQGPLYVLEYCALHLNRAMNPCYYYYKRFVACD